MSSCRWCRKHLNPLSLFGEGGAQPKAGRVRGSFCEGRHPSPSHRVAAGPSLSQKGEGISYKFSSAGSPPCAVMFTDSARSTA